MRSAVFLDSTATLQCSNILVDLAVAIVYLPFLFPLKKKRANLDFQLYHTVMFSELVLTPGVVDGRGASDLLSLLFV